jgi:transcription initiation factor IIF auxiliary subunit
MYIRQLLQDNINEMKLKINNTKKKIQDYKKEIKFLESLMND